MQGKRGVILGVANNRSIDSGIAKACHDAGAEIALTWQGDALKKRVEPLAKELNGLLLGHCDVTDSATIDAVFAALGEKWDSSMLISCYSLTAITQRAEEPMTDGGLIIDRGSRRQRAVSVVGPVVRRHRRGASRRCRLSRGRHEAPRCARHLALQFADQGIA